MIIEGTRTTLKPSNGVLLWALVPTLAFGFSVGTGGDSTPVYLKERGTKGYALANYERSAPMRRPRTVEEDLRQVRAVFRPTMSDLATILNVSRQAVYDWQAGKTIADENAARLANLARAADVLQVEGVTVTRRALRRPLTEGLSFTEIVRSGGDAEDAARALVALLRRESEQRLALQKRLAGRASPPPSIYEELGSPMLDESA